jgi:hypothetical protein
VLIGLRFTAGDRLFENGRRGRDQNESPYLSPNEILYIESSYESTESVSLWNVLLSLLADSPASKRLNNGLRREQTTHS